MTEGERAILNQISELRKEVNSGLKESRSEISKVHARVDLTNISIDATNSELATVKGIAVINKSKIGMFVAGMTFIFTTVGTIISTYINKH